MYSGVVVPFAGYSFGTVYVRDGGIYASDDSFVYRLEGNSWQPMLKTEGAGQVSVDQSGIWLEYQDADPAYSRLVDEAGNTVRQEYFAPSCAIRIGDELFFNRTDSDMSLCKKRDGSEIVGSSFADIYEPPARLADGMLIETVDGVVRCLNTDFSERWSLPSRQSVVGGLKQRPQVHSGTGDFLINFGVGDDSVSYRSLVVSAADGRILREFVFPNLPTFCNLIGDKVYAGCDGNLSVYDFVSGAKLSTKELPDDCFELRWLCAHDDYLIIGGNPSGYRVGESGLSLFVLDASTLNTLQILHVPQEVGRSKPAAEFVVIGERVFLPVWSPSLDNPYAAMVVLSASASEQAEEITLPLPTRPDFRVTKMENAKGETEYMVSVSHSSLDELWVWSAWVLKDLALSVGYATVVDKKSFDKKHNGIIHYAADLSVLGATAEAKLKDMLAAVEHSLRSIRPGMKKNSFKLQFMKVS